MNKSIEEIWKEGVLEETNILPRINDFYNLKSINVVDRIIKYFSLEVQLLIPIGIGLFLINLFLDNDYSVLWGIICAVPCLVFYYFGIKQVKALKNIRLGTNCYDYLLSVKRELNKVRLFNKTLAKSVIVLILTPLIGFTYFNNSNKTIGDVFGIEILQLSMVHIFWIMLLIVFLSFISIEKIFNIKNSKYIIKLNDLIIDLEKLKNSE